MQTKQHVFEHLGQPPYCYKGCVQLCQAACDHCGTGIRYAYIFESADGKVFKVGSSCVWKSGDAGLRSIVKAEERKLKAIVKAEAEAALLPTLREELLRLLQQHQQTLQQQQHPFIHDGVATLADYYAYVIPKANVSKLKRLRRCIAIDVATTEVTQCTP